MTDESNRNSRKEIAHLKPNGREWGPPYLLRRLDISLRRLRQYVAT